MKNKAILFAALLCFALSLIHQKSFALGFEAGVGYWGQKPSGTLAYNPVSSSDKLDIEEDLNYDKEYRPFARVKIELPLTLPNIYLMATPMKFEETGSKDADFTFGDITLNGSQPFDAMLRLDHYDVALYYPIPMLKTASLGKFNVEFGINARIIDLEAEVSGSQAVTGTSVTESKKFTIPVPMIYAGVQIKPFDKFSIEAEGRGIAYHSNHYYDLIGRVKIKPVWPLFIAGGYRHEDIKIDVSDVEASVKFSGPFVEAGVEF
jgi:outer membrane protein